MASRETSQKPCLAADFTLRTRGQLSSHLVVGTTLISVDSRVAFPSQVIYKTATWHMRQISTESGDGFRRRARKPVWRPTFSPVPHIRAVPVMFRDPLSVFLPP